MLTFRFGISTHIALIPTNEKPMFKFSIEDNLKIIGDVQVCSSLVSRMI